MITLAVLAALLVAAAIFFIARPLFVDHGAEVNAAMAQLAAVRDRLLGQLHELEVQRGDGSMDPAVAETEQARLEFELAQALKQLEAGKPVAEAQVDARLRLKWPAAAVLALMLPLIAGGLYLLQNRHTLNIVSRLGASTPAAPDAPAAPAGLPPMVMEMVGRLEKKLQAQPNDPQGWAQLGRSYSVLNRSEDAKAAYAKAYALAPDDIEILSNYAWTIYSANPTQPSPEAVKLYRKLYQREPAHQDALWVLGLAAYNDSNFQQAVDHWQKLYATLPPDSAPEKSVRAALEEARAKLKGK